MVDWNPAPAVVTCDLYHYWWVVVKKFLKVTHVLLASVRRFQVLQLLMKRPVCKNS